MRLRRSVGLRALAELEGSNKLTKIKYDVSDVEVSDVNYNQPKPGVYGAKIFDATPRNTDGKNDIEVIVEVTDKGEFQAARLWTYVHLGEASRWKMRELTDAVGLPPKGVLDTDKLVGKKLKIKVNAGSYEGEYRARVQRFLKAGDSVDGSDESDDGDYDNWELDDLKAEVEERGLEIAGRKSKEKLIAALLEDDGGSEEEEPEESEEEESEDDYDTWSVDDLKTEAEEKGVIGNISGRKTKEKLIEALRAESVDDAEPEDDYDEWDIEELISEANDRSLDLPAGRKSKEKLISLLRADDAEDPFAE